MYIACFVLATNLSTAEGREFYFRVMSFRVCWRSVLYIYIYIEMESWVVYVTDLLSHKFTPPVTIID